MKKLYTVTAVVTIAMQLLFYHSSFAQTETDTTFYSQMNYIFANLDKSKVPNGILRDFAMEFTNLENYNGTAALADSNYADARAFWDVYQTLLTGRVSASASGFVSPAVADSLWYIQRDTGLIVLSGLYFNYSRFKDNAANNYVTISNGRLYDKYVGGVWQNPYQGEQAFLLSPPINSYSELNLKIALPANLWFTNNGAAVTALQIDAGDGLGYRTLTAGAPLSISYADTGHKEWKYKLTITGGATLYSHSDMYIQTKYSAAGGGQYRMMSPQGVEDYPVFSFTASQSYLGVAGKGYATIKYANPDHIIRKPLIVAEGYDPGHILKPEEKFGYTSLEGFLEDINTSLSDNLKTLLNGSPSQYDIIYVDWRNGTDYLQRNAYLLETIIQWVNANKQAVGGVMQPNVVLGQSMGGVIARYALRDMENNSINHQTRLYISDDAPQLGANVPQGYQHLARHGRSLYIKTGVTAVLIEIVQLIRGGVSPLQALSLADQPASKQMLLNFVNGSNTIDNTVHTTWQTELKNMGYPNGVSGIPFRKVAVSNGSECANPQPFGAGDNLLTYNGKANTRILGDLAGMVGLPIAGVFLGQPPLLLGIIPGRNDFNFDFAVNAQADGVSNQVYKGKITYSKKVLWLIPVNATITNRSYYSNASTLPYDYFPGGYYNTGLDLSSSANQNFLFKYNITASNQPTFNFVPTVSALDIGGGNVTLTKTDYLTRYIGANPPASPKNTPFDNFITAFNNDRVNEQHISIERRNGDWVAAELNEEDPIADCVGHCENNIPITGPEAACLGTYSVPFISGAAYIWSVSPAGPSITTYPASPNTIAISAGSQHYGQYALSVLIEDGSCANSVGTKTIELGLAPPYPAGPFDPQTNYELFAGYPNVPYYFEAQETNTNYAPFSYTWTLTPPGGGSSSTYSGQSPTITFPATGYYSLKLRKNSASCFSVSVTKTVVILPYYGGFAVEVYPNPASGIAEIRFTDSAGMVVSGEVESQGAKKSQKVNVLIYDRFGTKVIQLKDITGKTIGINVASLPNGIYIAEVSDKNGRKGSKRFVVHH